MLLYVVSVPVLQMLFDWCGKLCGASSGCVLMVTFIVPSKPAVPSQLSGGVFGGYFQSKIFPSLHDNGNH